MRRALLDSEDSEPPAVEEPLAPLPEAPVEEAVELVAVEAGVVPFGLTEKVCEDAKTCSGLLVLTKFTV